MHKKKFNVVSTTDSDDERFPYDTYFYARHAQDILDVCLFCGASSKRVLPNLTSLFFVSLFGASVTSADLFVSFMHIYTSTLTRQLIYIVTLKEEHPFNFKMYLYLSAR